MTAETFDDLPIKQRTVSAGAFPMSKPAGAVTSIFEAGTAAKRKRAPMAPPPRDVEILSGIPIPPAVRDKGRSDVYGDLIRRMKDGDMVLLEQTQARTMRSRAKKLGVEVTLRVAENNKVGVWRVGLLVSQGPNS